MDIDVIARKALASRPLNADEQVWLIEKVVDSVEMVEKIDPLNYQTALLLIFRGYNDYVDSYAHSRYGRTKPMTHPGYAGDSNLRIPCKGDPDYVAMDSDGTPLTSWEEQDEMRESLVEAMQERIDRDIGKDEPEDSKPEKAKEFTKLARD